MRRSSNPKSVLSRLGAFAITFTAVLATIGAPAFAAANPFAGTSLWKDPSWIARSNDGALKDLAKQPVAVWITGSGDTWTQVRNAVAGAEATKSIALLVAYNIPGRDCGGYSAGGANSAGAYQAWIGSFAAAIGNGSAAVILEPDALNTLDCMSAGARQERLSLLNGAVNVLESKPNTVVYIDAGHPSWKSAAEMASSLKSAGVANAQGFALNVSNFHSNAENNAYGTDIANRIGGKHFVVDTSRNGNTAVSGWCNPRNAEVGTRPTGNTGVGVNDAYLWVKRPGESDGNCNGGPGAGQWFASYAHTLVAG